jgi:hypothetical protein
VSVSAAEAAPVCSEHCSPRYEILTFKLRLIYCRIRSVCARLCGVHSGSQKCFSRYRAGFRQSTPQSMPPPALCNPTSISASSSLVRLSSVHHSDFLASSVLSSLVLHCVTESVSVKTTFPTCLHLLKCV